MARAVRLLLLHQGGSEELYVGGTAALVHEQLAEGRTSGRPWVKLAAWGADEDREVFVDAYAVRAVEDVDG